MKHIRSFDSFLNEGTYDSSDSIAIYSGPDGIAEVEKRKDGSYYASCEDYDFSAKDKAEMAKKLKDNGFTTLLSGKLEESHEDLQNYMFFSNLESIKRKCEAILAMDFKSIDDLLNAGGHDWAADHIAVAKENVDQVENFLVGQFEDSKEEIPTPSPDDKFEPKLDEAKVTLDATDPNEKGLVSFCKKHDIKWKIVNMTGPAGGWPEVEYVGKKKDLEKMIKNFWEADGEDSGLAEYIEENTIQ
jgi:hypothetical protein